MSRFRIASSTHGIVWLVLGNAFSEKLVQFATFGIEKVGHCFGIEERGKEDPGEDILFLARRTNWMRWEALWCAASLEDATCARR
jgi:hypothetical protein